MIADTLREGGDVVSAASVVSELVSVTTSTSGVITATVEMTTTLTIAPDGTGNSTTATWSDPHRITLAPMGGISYAATSDTTLEAPPNTEDPGDDPTPGTPDLPPDPTTPGPIKSIPPQPTPLALPVSTASATEALTTTASGPEQIESSATKPAGVAGSRSATPLLTTAGYPTETMISPTRFSDYAVKWTSAPYNGNDKSDFNSDYPFYNNNCANFASQVLDVGGWYLTGGGSWQQNDTSKWTYNLAGYKGATRTWYSARYLYKFANNTGTYGWLDNIWNARKGDLLFTDWDPNGRPDGDIDHVMVVSGVSSLSEPRISQKSNNRSNILLSTSIALAKRQGKTITWYGLKHK